MKTPSEELLNDLKERTKTVLARAEDYRDIPANILNHKPSETSWSALECIEHLKRYSDFYLHEMARKIKHSNHSPEETFRSGFLGNRFAKMMAPSDKPFKMKTFPSKNPNGSELGMETLEEFIHQQQQTLELLSEAQSANLNKVKVKTTLGPLFKLRLGDAFRVVIYHNQRHIQQADRAIKHAISDSA